MAKTDKRIKKSKGFSVKKKIHERMNESNHVAHMTGTRFLHFFIFLVNSLSYSILNSISMFLTVFSFSMIASPLFRKYKLKEGYCKEISKKQYNMDAALSISKRLFLVASIFLLLFQKQI